MDPEHCLQDESYRHFLFQKDAITIDQKMKKIFFREIDTFYKLHVFKNLNQCLTYDHRASKRLPSSYTSKQKVFHAR
jgi:hypothetical protein